jgi:hypothetical protein
VWRNSDPPAVTNPLNRRYERLADGGLIADPPPEQVAISGRDLNPWNDECIITMLDIEGSLSTVNGIMIGDTDSRELTFVGLVEDIGD